MFGKKLPVNHKAAVALIETISYHLNTIKKDIRKGQLRGISNDLRGIRGFLDDIERHLFKK